MHKWSRILACKKRQRAQLQAFAKAHWYQGNSTSRSWFHGRPRAVVASGRCVMGVHTVGPMTYCYSLLHQNYFLLLSPSLSMLFFFLRIDPRPCWWERRRVQYELWGHRAAAVPLMEAAQSGISGQGEGGAPCDSSPGERRLVRRALPTVKRRQSRRAPLDRTGVVGEHGSGGLQQASCSGGIWRTRPDRAQWRAAPSFFLLVFLF